MRLANFRWVLLGLLIVLCSPAFALDRNALFDEANLLLLPRERQLPSLELIDEHGNTFSTDSLRGN